MILPFSTQIKGKPTYFVEKIWKGLKSLSREEFEQLQNKIATEEMQRPYEVEWQYYENATPKLHSIRDDVNNRWRAGVIIDFFINARTKKMKRFAPRIPCTGTQKVFMTYAFNKIIEISVDDKYINDTLTFAKNDGFDTWDDFFDYFYPKIMANPDQFYKGKLIHWTNLRY